LIQINARPCGMAILGLTHPDRRGDVMSYLTYPTWLIRVFQRFAFAQARMGRMLRRRGIPPGAYLRAFPFIEVEAQLARCHACPCKGLCDRALASRAPTRSRYSFCANARFIDSYIVSRVVGEGCDPAR
jgi:hypothetical protein